MLYMCDNVGESKLCIDTHRTDYIYIWYMVRESKICVAFK